MVFTDLYQMTVMMMEYFNDDSRLECVQMTATDEGSCAIILIVMVFLNGIHLIL